MLLSRASRTALFLALLFGGAIEFQPSTGLAQAQNLFGRSTLAVISATGRHQFNIEVAATPSQRSQGLMWRRSLAPNAGMLFDFDAPEPVTMWMKNTYIGLDMLFIGDDGRIVNIARNTTPHSLAMISSLGPVRAVLELAAGTAERLGLRAGDRIEHGLFR